MASFDHILLTRFNARWSARTASHPGTDPAWLGPRFDLFEKFCLPSVNGQSNQRFKWIVLLDTATPSVFKERIWAHSRMFPNLIPVFIDFAFPEGHCPDALKEIVRRHVSGRPSHLITTRLDNDDAVCKQYIDIIQSRFHGQHLRAINFVLGYQLFEGNLYIDFSIGNHFITLIEDFDPESFHTVFGRHHGKLDELAPVDKILAKPAWLEVVHGRNKANSCRGGLPVSIKRLRIDFILRPDALNHDERRPKLWIRQLLFFGLLLPIYLGSKLVNRLRHHSPRKTPRNSRVYAAPRGAEECTVEEPGET